jgi:creatinine amidohydrolase
VRHRIGGVAMTSVRWEEMFPDELDAALAAHPVAYLTLGLCEPHGLHNAVGLDALKAHGLAVEAATRHGGIVAPPFFWHIHEQGIEAAWADANIGDRNPWLTSLPHRVFYKVVWYQLRTLEARGFKGAILMTGHWPYENDLKRLAEVFMRHSALRIWAGSDGECRNDREGFEQDHAGRYETSVMWSLHPTLVDTSRLEPAGSPDGGPPMATGSTAPHASRRYGDELVAGMADWLGRKAEELVRSHREPERPGVAVPGNPRGALSFDEAERIWQAEVEPLLDDFVSADPGPEVPDGSPWRVNRESAGRA